MSASDLKVGDKVYNAARILGAPHALFAKLVTSTGTGTNGPDDTLPESYGNGAPLHYSFFDRADACDKPIHPTLKRYVLPARYGI